MNKVNFTLQDAPTTSLFILRAIGVLLIAITLSIVASWWLMLIQGGIAADFKHGVGISLLESFRWVMIISPLTLWLSGRIFSTSAELRR